MDTNQKAKTTARIAPRNAPTPTWGLVPAAADGEVLVPTATAVADLDTLDPVAGLDTLGPEEGLDTLGRPEVPELTGTEVNETGLGVGVTVKEGVMPPINRINNEANFYKVKAYQLRRPVVGAEEQLEHHLSCSVVLSKRRRRIEIGRSCKHNRGLRLE